MLLISYAAFVLGFSPPEGAEAPPAIQTVSTGQAFVLEKVLQPEQPTIFLFYLANSTVEEEVVKQLEAKVNGAGHTGLRLIKLKSLDAPAAQLYDIRKTPTFLVLDRFGKLKIRTNNPSEIVPVVGKAVRMARIKWVDENDPNAPEVYHFPAGQRRQVAGILKTMSLRPELLAGINQVAGMAHFSNGFLPRKTKEMIATYVSAVNHCKF
jgi:hypothetical protein